jgi:Ca2+-transporting ATPase
VDIEGGADAVTLADTLAGLSYIMEYRIKGKFPHLDLDLMRRVCKALLMYMGNKQGKGFSVGGNTKGFTPESDMAFVLFAEFFQEVEEFRQAVSEVPETDLRTSLHIAERCKNGSQEQRQSCVALLLLLQTLPQFRDWRELVDDEGLSQVESVYNQMAPGMTVPQIPFSKEELYPPPSLYFDRKVDRLADMFNTDINIGLSSAVVADLQAHYGPNQLPRPKPPSVLKMIWNQLTDFMVILLIVVVIVELAFRSWPEAIVLAAVVVLNVIIGFSQEYKANQAMEALMSLSVPMAVVIRDGQQQKIDAALLVPGDVVILEEGDAVPADLRIVESAQLEVIEAILTGESLPCSKNPKHIRARTRKLPLGDCKGNAFMSTVVAKGRGKGIVVRIGLATEIGKISAAITSQPHQKTPIQKRLDRLGVWLVAIAVILCALVVVIGVAWRNPVMDMVEVGISLAVSVIPEGLVAVTTVTMAMGVSRMASQNAIVRKLPSVETLGSVTVICSDKTGTLTEGKMGTAMMWTSDGQGYNFTKSTDLDPTVGGIAYAMEASASTSGNPLDATSGSEIAKTLEACPAQVVLATLVCALCNNSTVALEDGAWKTTGDPTEVALLVAAQKAGFGREWWVSTGGLSKVGEYAFDSERKLMSAVYAPSGQSGVALNFQTAVIAVKGAPEALLSRCTYRLPPSEVLGPNATVADLSAAKVPLDEDFVKIVSDKSAEMAGYGLRMLGLAIRSVSVPEASDIIKAEKSQAAESDLVFVGLVGLIDPPKAGVKEAVETCKRAGIKVIMITGDHIATASAIAKQLGILDPNDPSGCRAMKGTDLDLLSEEGLGELRPFPSVFARVRFVN